MPTYFLFRHPASAVPDRIILPPPSASHMVQGTENPTNYSTPRRPPQLSTAPPTIDPSSTNRLATHADLCRSPTASSALDGLNSTRGVRRSTPKEAGWPLPRHGASQDAYRCIGAHKSGTATRLIRRVERSWLKGRKSSLSAVRAEWGRSAVHPLPPTPSSRCPPLSITDYLAPFRLRVSPARDMSGADRDGLG